MSEIKAGKYTAKIIDYGLRPGKEGKKPSVQIVFKSEAFTLSWFGQLETDKNKEFTAKTLSICGCQKKLSSIEDWIAFNAGAGSGVLNESKELEIEVKVEEYEGKTRAKVAWVNEPGSGSIREKMAKEDLISQMSGVNLGALMTEEESKRPKVKNHAENIAKKDVVPF